MRGLRGWLRLLGGIAILVAIVVAVVLPQAAWNAAQLPLLALFSTTRMVLAYLLSLVFAITYGATAATNKKAAVIMLPVLDVLQSVPILGFFPAALVFFVATFQGSPVGIELAVVFLIFTSMAWNMAFGVYEALTTIPVDLESAAASFGLRGWLRFRHLSSPAAIPKLVYNSILSWTNGWFFLVASEIFTAGGTEFKRPGLGAFIAIAGRNGDAASIAIGIGVLAAVVLTLDIFLWRPLSAYSERFRMETVTGREIPRVPSPYERFRWLPRLPRLRQWTLARLQPVAARSHRMSLQFERAYSGHPKVIKEVRRIDLALFLIVFVLVVSTGLIGLAQMFLRPLPLSAALLPTAAFLSFSRLLLAYGIALAWTIPVAAFIGESERASRYLTPAFELFGSLPATALLPVIVGFALLVTAPFEVPGLGSLLNHAVFDPVPDSEMLLLTILTMIVVVLAMNKLLWRPLFRRASQRFRLEV